MKKLFKTGLFLIVLSLTLGLSSAYAFNSATHLYIAEQVFKDNNINNINLYYGSIAPDLSLYVATPENWSTAFEDTHYTYIDLRPYAVGFTQKAFASGWLTHNEDWGADHCAHIEYPLGSNKGYVVEKAEELSYQTGLDPEFAQLAVEVAIDLLLRNNDDPRLGEKLLKADLLRSWKDRYLLVKVLVWKERRTDWLTLATAELTFRDLVGRYAVGLALPDPQNKEALAELGAQLAGERYGIEVSPAEVLNLLELAIGLCEGDYKEVVDFAIEQIKDNI
ncbi:hypothetical protein BMS3Bbin07_01193 [bacterium BMS3Bbin07]|nr:hypothetical protein BMS3Bbin07_01193 [bacterium BMS3Bbin07]HDH53420.1 hypothetical protein [Nitrospirota bacterium]